MTFNPTQAPEVPETDIQGKRVLKRVVLNKTARGAAAVPRYITRGVKASPVGQEFRKSKASFQQTAGYPRGSSFDLFASENASQYVLYLAGAAFIIRFVANLDVVGLNKKKIGKGEAFFGGLDNSGFLSWVLVVSILLIMSKFQLTDDLAVAFALVILLSVFLTDGITLFEKWGILEKTVKLSKKSGTPNTNRAPGPRQE